MPVIAHPAVSPAGTDSAHSDSASLAHYEPRFTNGFPDSVGNDTVVTAMSSLPVMEQPTGKPAQPYTGSLLHSTGTMSLVLASLLLILTSYRTGYKYLENFFHNMFSTRRQESIFEDHTLNETGIQSALIINTCIMEGLLLFHGIALYVPRLAIPLSQSPFLHVAVFAGIALLFFLAQLVVYNLIGYVFSDRVSSKLWVDGFKASQSLLGLLLLPVVGVLLVNPHGAPHLITIGIVLYALSRLVFISKGFRIFYSNLPSIVYFILYLCAVEIVPLSVVLWTTLYVCGNLQS